MDQKSNDQSAKGRRLIVGIAIGLAIGTGLGVAMGNISTGEVIGLGLGVGWAICTNLDQKKISSVPSDSDSSDANATASGGEGHDDRNKQT